MRDLINKSIQLKGLAVYEIYNCRSETSLNALLPLITNQILFSLTVLTIRGYLSEFTNISIYCKELRSFSLLGYESEITENLLVQIIENNKHLEHLTLEGFWSERN